MPELEKEIEQKFIDKLCSGESQWTYCPEINNEEKLWANFKYILEQNNKRMLNDTPLSDEEFAKIKNDVSHASFYDAAKWLVGENGKVMVHINRGNLPLHLTVIDNLQIAGGTSTYQVINQYQAFKNDEDDRDRRFDVTLLINGVPMIHVELKNRQHPYMDGFYQIQNYIREGKFRGLFSNVQMFVISNASATRYFAPARDYELNKKLLTGWVDADNKTVDNYLDFAEAVLRIPTAHEMIAKYTVLDDEKKKVIVLRPYQIHAIEAIRELSKRGESGFIWAATGSGKTLTSYKTTRNLIIDIPSLDKTIFLVDRKELDNQTGQDFQAYAQNDIIDVNDTEHTSDLVDKLVNGKREMIVTTRQKLQLVTKRITPGHKYYDKLTHLKLAFVVDECHRAVTPETKRELENYFRGSRWYGFTGTPILPANPYPKNGDLPRTTEELYGKCAHSYTIKEAIKDNSVLGFQVENLGAKLNGESSELYNTKEHRKQVLDFILNKSAGKLGLSNGPGNTYSAILSVNKIEKAQYYYNLLKDVKEGKYPDLQISPEIKKALPDFPKFAITYSLTENEESSHVNEKLMEESLKEYNEMFGTSYKTSEIEAYNNNLSDRLARRTSKFSTRDQQLDIVIVVDRLLTGFNAPAVSTIFLDRPPMNPQMIIQAFSRTNRLLDAKKMYGQVVTFQYPDEFETAINEALKLYSNGSGTEGVTGETWEEVLNNFKIAVKRVKEIKKEIDDAPPATDRQKAVFIKAFRMFDTSYAHLQNFTKYEPSILEAHDVTEEEIEEWIARYKNYVAELAVDNPNGGDEPDISPEGDYELVSIHNFTVNFEYIINLIGNIVNTPDDSEAEFSRKVQEAEESIVEFSKEDERLGNILRDLLEQIKVNREDFANKNVSEIVHEMCEDAIMSEAIDFSNTWFVPVDDVMYEIQHFRYGQMANSSKFKEKANYAKYKESVEKPLAKFTFRRELQKAFENKLMPSVATLVKH